MHMQKRGRPAFPHPEHFIPTSARHTLHRIVHGGACMPSCCTLWPLPPDAGTCGACGTQPLGGHDSGCGHTPVSARRCSFYLMHR